MFKIGVSSFMTTTQPTTHSRKWFKLQIGDNVYRILPPLFSLADVGQFAKYYKVHTLVYDTVENNSKKYRVFSFICPTQHDKNASCPICNKYLENLKKYDLLKKQQIPQEQLQWYFKREILNYKAERKVYMNVINMNNEIGVLTVPHTVYKMIISLLIDFKNKYNIDMTGEKGVFINIIKHQERKGDLNVTYRVEAVQEVSHDGTMRLKQHALTPDLINQLEVQAQDLNYLFKELPYNTLLEIASVKHTEQLGILDKAFSSSEEKNKQAIVEQETTKTVDNGILYNTYPGTNAYIANKVHFDNNNEINITGFAQSNTINNTHKQPQLNESNNLQHVSTTNTTNQNSQIQVKSDVNPQIQTTTSSTDSSNKSHNTPTPDNVELTDLDKILELLG